MLNQRWHHVRTVRTLSVFVVSVMIFASFSTVLPSIHVAHAVSARSIFVDPQSQPLQAKGSQLSYGIKWQTSFSNDTINAWDITVNVTSFTRVLSPVDVSITGTILGAAGIQELRNCVNGGRTPDDHEIPTGTPGNIGCAIGDGPGIAHSAVFSTTPSALGANGLLFTIKYQVMVDGGFTPIRFVDHVVSFVGGIAAPHDAIDGEYGTRPGKDPVASFTYTPVNPTAGDPVTFNATPSHDDPANVPNGITLFAWIFGDGSRPVSTTNSSTVHAFTSSGGAGLTGNFTVTLTVTNKLGLTGVAKIILSIVNLPFHDIAVEQIKASQQDSILAGTPIGVSVIVVDHGTFPEKGFNLTVSVENRLLKTYNYTGGLTTNNKVTEGPVTWNTTGLPVGVYEIRAELMPLRAANGTIIESNSCPTKNCLSNNVGYILVRIGSSQGASLVSLSIVQSAGLVIGILVAAGAAWSMIGGRVDRRRRQQAEALP